MSKMFLKSSLRLWAISLLLPALASAAVLPAMPALTVAAGSSGQAAITALGTNLTAVAAHYGKTAAQLISLFQNDRTLRLDGRGNLYYICAGVSQSAPEQNRGAVKLLPYTNTFFLHSKLGSTKTPFQEKRGTSTTPPPVATILSRHLGILTGTPVYLAPMNRPLFSRFGFK